MRRVQGQVTFGGRVAYCAQTAWIQNASLVSRAMKYSDIDADPEQRENITFGLPFDEDRVSA